MLNVRDLTFAYGKQQVLRGVTFYGERGEMLFLLGQNGAGKSTLFRCLLQQLRPKEGEICIDNTPIRKMNTKELAKRVAYIPQSAEPGFAYPVVEMVVMGRTAHLSALGSPGKEDYRLAMETLERLRMAHLAEKSFAEISGGEQQMVLIARALVQQSDILIMDEPTANLDYGNQLKALEQVRALCGDGKLVLVSSHNPQHALQFADRVLTLKDGVITEDGVPEKVITPQQIQQLYGAEVTVRDGVILPKGGRVL